ncbi:MAG: ATP synthase F1 subunit delta [Deltaproteobacteria bacterium]|nr:ATP synthase F1 subunit delta [Deltaproteobacteria bacterium]
MTDILSKRYAKALLLLGQEDGNYRLYGQELSGFEKVLEETGEVGKALISPFYPKDQRGRALAQILDQSTLSGPVKNFIKILHDRGRLERFKAITSVYAKLSDEADGLIRGTLTSAVPVTESQLSAVKGALNTMSGSRVELEVVIDPTIIGGLVARLGDLVIDSSLKTQLERLDRHLADKN